MICGDIEKLYDECMENLIQTHQEKLGCGRNAVVKIFDERKVDNKIVIEKWM